MLISNKNPVICCCIRHSEWMWAFAVAASSKQATQISLFHTHISESVKFNFVEDIEYGFRERKRRKNEIEFEKMSNSELEFRSLRLSTSVRWQFSVIWSLEHVDNGEMWAPNCHLRNCLPHTSMIIIIIIHSTNDAKGETNFFVVHCLLSL